MGGGQRSKNNAIRSALFIGTLTGVVMGLATGSWGWGIVSFGVGQTVSNYLYRTFIK